MTFAPETARAFAWGHAMFPPGVRVVALVSGGADSTALLLLLAEGLIADVESLNVLHVNHMLRGEESDADEAFVVGLCDRLGVRCSAVRYDVAAYADGAGLNLEDAGRRIRYRFADDELEALLAAEGAPRDHGRIAVAHTLDDRIETWFMRALSGAGSGGLASIAPVRGRVVRPLLGSRRDDLRRWLVERGEDWHEDSSNVDTERFRARVRHELLPAAERVNPGYAENLARTMDLLGEEDALLDDMARAFAHDFAERRDDEVVFRRHLMLTLSRPMARRTVRAALIEAFPEASRIEFEHVEALVDGLSHDGFARDLPFGLRAFTEYDTMVLARAGEEPRCVAPALLPIPGTVELGPAGRIRAEEAKAGDVRATATSIVFDASGVAGDLVVDSVRPGDRMRPFGMEGSRKLSDLLVDAKVPKRVRGIVPVVRDGELVVWLAGIRMSETHRVGPLTERPVRLTWTPEGENGQAGGGAGSRPGHDLEDEGQ